MRMVMDRSATSCESWRAKVDHHYQGAILKHPTVEAECSDTDCADDTIVRPDLVIEVKKQRLGGDRCKYEAIGEAQCAVSSCFGLSRWWTCVAVF